MATSFGNFDNVEKIIKVMMNYLVSNTGGYMSKADTRDRSEKIMVQLADMHKGETTVLICNSYWRPSYWLVQRLGNESYTLSKHSSETLKTLRYIVDIDIVSFTAKTKYYVRES